MANKKTPSKKRPAAKKRSAQKKQKKQKKQTNCVPVYIITLCIITLLTAVFMYIDYGEGGVINGAVKSALCGLFGVCGFFVPAIFAGLSAYMVKTKNIKGFWLKTLYSVLALINVCALVSLTDADALMQTGAAPAAFYAGKTYFMGGGFFGALVASAMVKLVQRIASYIILILTLILLASLISGVSIVAVSVKWVKNALDDARIKYDDYSEQRAEKEKNEKQRYADKDILDAANSFASETKDKPSKRKKKEKTPEPEITTPRDKPFSNGIDEIFADMPPVGSDRAEKPTEKAEQSEKVPAMTDAEKDKFSTELNAAIEKPPIKYVYPKTTLLDKPVQTSGDKREEMRRTAEKLISVLDDFGVKAKLMQVTQGPTVTRYEIQPDTGVKLSKISGLADDLALNLAVTTVLVAPVPGKAAVGIEVPNKKISSVSIREILESEEFKKSKSKLTFALGEDIGGNVVVGDISKMPHLLIAGATGSGKSVCINTIIMSILYKSSPEDVKLIMIDPKRVELGVYNGIPHLLVPVVTDPKKAAGTLNWAVTEMMHRYDLFTETGVRQLESYNKLMEKNGGEKIPQLVIIIDELADLMMVSAKEVEDYIVRLTQLARAAGIYLIIATQRPSVDVITGLIKANVPSRIALSVSSQVDSRTIIDRGGAEKLLGRGDMLYHPSGARAATRVQGAFVKDAEIEAVVGFIKEKCGEVHYSEDLEEEIERCATGENGVTPDVEEDGDSLLPEAIELAMSLGKISTSMIQRRLGVGYSRAGRIIDQMEMRGIISGANGSKPRDVLVSHADIPAAQGDYDEE